MALGVGLSLAAHSAVIGVLAISPDRPVSKAPREAVGLMRIQLRPTCIRRSCIVSPTPAPLLACFHESILMQQGWCEGSESVRTSFPTDAPGGWVRVAVEPTPKEADGDEGDGVAQELERAAQDECLDVAKAASWSGRGRVFVRIDREDAETAIVRVEPLTEEAPHEGLLCCLRQAQAFSAGRMDRGSSLRFDLVFDEGGAHAEHRFWNRRGRAPESRIKSGDQRHGST